MTTSAAVNVAYQSGFGNEFSSEALAGALPRGQNSPQRVPFGLYAEQLSGTAFTVPRAMNRRTWLYRIRPSAAHPSFRPFESHGIRGTPFNEVAASPNRLRWNPQPFPDPDAPADFIDGLVTMAGNGDAGMHAGIGIHIYAANRSMTDRVLYDADGELLFVPETGAILLFTELGKLVVAPGQIAVMPRGVRFRVELLEGRARGYVCENYGAPFRLPELGPIGANGLANPRDFLAPEAAFEDLDRPTELIAKFGGRLWSTQLDRSPLDVVAWHGNYVPYLYDVAAFNTINTVSYDHPDPSIFTVLTSPSDAPGTANVDFVVFPPRWLVAEHTFRPPWFHRNVMNEFMGLVRGRYEAKPEGFVPGGASLHNCMSPHGPDSATFERASDAPQEPQRLDDTLAIMFESRYVIVPTAHAMQNGTLQPDYDSVWTGLRPQFGG